MLRRTNSACALVPTGERTRTLHSSFVVDARGCVMSDPPLSELNPLTYNCSKYVIFSRNARIAISVSRAGTVGIFRTVDVSRDVLFMTAAL